MPSSSKVTTVVIDAEPGAYEEKYVHEIYDQIASHFSSTRYKPWPIIAQFLDSLPSGWVGLDSGTGNGKYLPLPSDRPGSIWTIGLDRSRNLLELAQNAGGENVEREVVWGDVLETGWRRGAFDYAISIATIHHLATPERRCLAVQRLLESVSPTHGRVLIYVWAIEQDEHSKRVIPTSQPSPDGHGPNLANTFGEDVFVPWKLTSPKPVLKDKKPRRTRADPKNAPRSNEAPEVQSEQQDSKVFNRYYHMFAEGELRGLVHEAANSMGLEIAPCPSASVLGGTKQRRGIEIVQDGWERSNYYIEIRCWQTGVIINTLEYTPD